jgi:hypothetical protein
VSTQLIQIEESHPFQPAHVVSLEGLESTRSTCIYLRDGRTITVPVPVIQVKTLINKEIARSAAEDHYVVIARP